jgi:multisubunit Na+/H+ antiporter MnhE subunit
MNRISLRSWISWLIAWVLMTALWLLFTVSFGKSEIIIGVVAALVGTLGVAMYEQVAGIRFLPTLPLLVQAWHVPGYMFAGFWELLVALMRQLFTRRGAQSAFTAVRYDVGGDDYAATARRALAVSLTTMTPNFLVLGIIQEQGLMIYHQVLVGPVRQMTKNLGAKP